jgi:L-fuculose-phosphate aldolase
VVTFGKNLLDAFLKMETVEHFASICLVAHQLGSSCPLSQDAVDQLLHAKARYVKNVGAMYPGGEDCGSGDGRYRLW